MKNFKKGDRVRFKGDGRIGEVFDIEGYNELIMDIVYWVRFPDGQEGTSPMQDLEFADQKTAFLRELQSLLRKYDVQIHDGEYYYIGFEIGANRGDSQTIHYSIGDLDEMCITPDNIFDYDKD